MSPPPAADRKGESNRLVAIVFGVFVVLITVWLSFIWFASSHPIEEVPLENEEPLPSAEGR